MAIKKKGTPEPLQIVVKESDLEQWRKLINEAVNSKEPFEIVLTTKPPKKDKK